MPVANSIKNIGLSKGKASMTLCAGPNIALMSTMVIAPKWELKLSLEESSLPPEQLKRRHKKTLINIGKRWLQLDHKITTVLLMAAEKARM